MGQRWQDRAVEGLAQDEPEPVSAEPRTLEWEEIAELIEIRPDGSWQPTTFGWAQFLDTERVRLGADYLQ
jgi:hypothetical protein